MLELQINENVFIGWDNVHIVRSLDNATSTFSFSSVQHPDNIQTLRPGAECKIIFDGVTMITGYIDKITASYDKNSRIFQVAGRSKTKDLVDCSAFKQFQFSKMSIKRLVGAIAETYGVIVSGGDDKTIINNFQIEQNGETCFSAIQRIAETKAFRITDNPSGELLLTQTGKTKTNNIIDGTNVLSSTATIDESQKYSKITVKGQAKSSNKIHGLKASQVVGSAEDATVERSRELIIKAENDASIEDAKKLAQWEVAARSAKSKQLNYKIQGWKGTANELWFENQIVAVHDKVFNINDDFLIVEVEYTVDGGGSVVNLKLADPESYVPKPVIIKRTSVNKKTTDKKKTTKDDGKTWSFWWGSDT